MSSLIATFDKDQLRDLSYLDGLYVGMLDKSDMRLFEDAEEAGLAHRVYDGPGAILGLSKVRVGKR